MPQKFVLTFTLVPPGTKCFSLLNPAHLKAQNLADCRYFCDHDPMTYVTGLNDAAEKIPYATFQKIREDLIGILGRSAYYRLMRREQWLDAQAQQRILAVFQSHGVEGHLIYDEVRQAY